MWLVPQSFWWVEGIYLCIMSFESFEGGFQESLLVETNMEHL